MFRLRRLMKPSGQSMPFRAADSQRSAGFTLPELLVGLVITAVLFSVVGYLLLNHMLSVRRIERGQRFREDANRFNYLLAIETGESSAIQYNTSLDAACSDGGTSLVSLTVPRPTGVYADATNVSRIFYYNLNGDIKRCGPPSNRNGVLDHGATSVTGVVARRTTLDVIASGGNCGRVSDNRTVVYNLNFADSGGGAYSQCQIARAKTVFVCNPPASSGGGIGDC
ncbi:type II secretion system protein [Cyanobium sp. NIES-981]|uniref:type II secretion system protein n=1 Tax=Cyanobium sp. NIES-981 TaxID=1851505 RepID=UPI0007DCC91C|nr:Prepilin-type N-terminal cleavage/methylation domain protein [Cyanobium sp. NIES-981]